MVLRMVVLAGIIVGVCFGAFALFPTFGEPPRFEQEYKVSFSWSLTEALGKEIYARIESELPKQHWENDTTLSGTYYMGSDLDTLVFEDIYFDTPDNLLAKGNISHRLRYRWKTQDDLRTYRERGVIPQRLELQTKVYSTGAISDSWGYKRAMKNRYEIKNDYRLNLVTTELLKRQNSDTFMQLLKTTPFWDKFSPVTLVRSTMEERSTVDFNYASIRPSAWIVTERTRFHINKKTPFGSGDNPDNAILVTLDRSRIYSDGEYRDEVGDFSEVEVDFERNTFHRLFDAVYRGGDFSLQPIITSFEKDQSTVKELITNVLRENGYQILSPEESSTKYLKSLEYLQ